MKKNIHIAIDGREANIKSRVGSNVYAFEIINSLEKIFKNIKQVKATVLLSSEKIDDLPEEREGWSYKVFGPEKFWTQWALPIHLFENKQTYDVFFTPGHYAPRHSPVPYVSTVMDTAFIDFPDHFKKSDTIKLTKWTDYSVKNASKVVTISQHTKDEVIKNYQKSPEDVVVAYPGVDVGKPRFLSKETNAFFKKHKITEPYLLFVGTIQPRKNLIRLIEAFEIFNRMNAGRSLKKKTSKAKSKELKRVKLVLAGKVGWLSDEIIKKIDASPLKNKIITTGFVSRKEKEILYKYAFASCLVGLYEGFGIPPLESLHLLTPPIVSNTTSLPEVVGKAGFLANPNNPEDIANKIWDAFTMNSREKGIFRKRARKQVKKFSWSKSAGIIFDTLMDVIEANTHEN